jgi:dihydroflavonol-4-reductase
MSLVAVTGSTGHIGNVLVRELLKKGQQVRAIVPAGEDISPLKNLKVEIRQADVRRLDSLIEAFSGVEMVYHLAGIISILPGRKKLLEEVNVQGTQNVCEACLKTGVRRLVYTSSIHAVKEPPHGICITEEQPFDPEAVLGDYGRSKARATLSVYESLKKGLDAVIVCPTGVMGPFDFKLSEMGKLFQDILSRKLKMYINGAYDFVDVRDVAWGIILAGERGRTGQSYILSGEQISVRNILIHLEKISGVKAPSTCIPTRLARLAGILATPYYLLSGTRPLFTAYSIDVLGSNSLVSSAKAKKELGFTARPIRESILDAVSWFKDEARRRRKSGKTDKSYGPA